jgi:HlyD family secretion protein/epimerase transport system membrane fusion protein
MTTISDRIAGGAYSNPVRPALVGIGAISAFAVLFAVWETLAPVSGAAIAEGNLQVEGQRQSVQHPYGGVVEHLFVKEGQQVKKGDTLLTLTDDAPRSNLDVLIAGRDSLLAQKNRLIAERENAKEPEFDNTLTARGNEATAAQAMANERAVMTARARQFDTESGILHAKVAQLNEQIDGISAQINGLNRQRDLIEEEAKGARELLGKGYTPKTRVLALERSIAQIESDRGAKLAERAGVRQAIDEAKLGIAKLERSRVVEITDQLGKAQSGLAEFGPKIDAARDVLQRTEIKSPVDGTAVGLAVFTEGGVIQPGARVLDVVPSNDALIANARLQLSDVNEVKAGSAADIRLTGVPRNERPKLRGEVMTVSADKLTDEKSGLGYYSLRVKLNPDDVAATHVHLQPGMPMEAIVTTRPRTLAVYLFGPLLDELTGAFRER